MVYRSCTLSNMAATYMTCFDLITKRSFPNNFIGKRSSGFGHLAKYMFHLTVLLIIRYLKYNNYSVWLSDLSLQAKKTGLRHCKTTLGHLYIGLFLMVSIKLYDLRFNRVFFT